MKRTGGATGAPAAKRAAVGGSEGADDDDDDDGAVGAEARAGVDEANAAARAQRVWLECGICLRPLRAGATVLLPCLDTVCRACAGDPGNAWPLHCPACGTVHTTLPDPAAAAALPPNLVLETILASPAGTTNNKQAAAGGDGDRCVQCEPDLPLEYALAVARCDDCGGARPRLLCVDHVRRHRLGTATRTHVLQTLRDDGAAAVRGEVAGLCATHSEPVKMYCRTCDAVACLACAITTHPAPRHRAVALDDGLLAAQADALHTAAAAAQARQTELAEAMVRVRHAAARGAAAVAAEHARAATVFDALVAALQRRRQGLAEALVTQAATHAAWCNDAELQLRLQWIGLDSGLRLYEATMSDQVPVAPAVLAAMAPRLTQRLQTVAAAPSGAVADAELHVPQTVVTEEEVARIAAIGRHLLPAHAPTCNVLRRFNEHDDNSDDHDEREQDGDAAAPSGVVYVGRPATFVVCLRNGSNAPVDLALRPAVRAWLVPDAAPTGAPQHAPPVVTVSPVAAAEVTLTFTPAAVGALMLHATVDGVALRDCPIPLTVAPNPVLYDMGADAVTFTNAGATGWEGPTLAQVRAALAASGLHWAYAPDVLEMGSRGVVGWRVPRTGTYRLTVAGAHGAMAPTGSTGARGGRGALVSGTLRLAAGDCLRIGVGQAGLTDGQSGGGGGASFVVLAGATATLLVVAGGGGGTRCYATSNGLDASVSEGGVSAPTDSSGACAPAAARDNTQHPYGDAGRVAAVGQGGCASSGSYGDGGAGWVGDGQDDRQASTVATALSGSARGGGMGQAGAGGFGGGGSGHGNSGGGGGGGYTGGNGGRIAGGGGSYVLRTRFTTGTAVIDTDRAYVRGGDPVHGYVRVALLLPTRRGAAKA
jgi:hypothetical protein